MTTYKTHLNPDDIPIALEQLLPPDQIRELAKKTSFIERDRVIDPVAWVWNMVLGFGVKVQRTLASLKRSYNSRANAHLSDGSWFERFTPEQADFMKANVRLAMSQMAGEANNSLNERLKMFDDILIQDSTVIRLHKALAKKWPPTRTRTVAAGVKVAMLISAVANGPRSIAIHGERTAEIKTIRVGPWIKNRILLMDLGFSKFQLYARIVENGGYFVSRLKDNGNPLFLSSFKVHRGASIDLAGKRWNDVKDKVMREVLDAEVEVALKRRKYAGKQSLDTLKLRMVAVFNPEAGQYHAYLTNIPHDVLCAEDIAALYRVRWEIELVFKELKSRYSLDTIKTTKAFIVEGLIWTAILTMLVSRRLYHLLKDSAPPEKVARYTQLRWANTFAETATDLLLSMLGHLGLGSPYKDGFESLARLYEQLTLDPHVNRKRLSDGWWS
jgi:IS4 transposase